MSSTLTNVGIGTAAVTGTGALGVAALNNQNQTGLTTAAEATAGLGLVGGAAYGLLRPKKGTSPTPGTPPPGDSVAAAAQKPAQTYGQEVASTSQKAKQETAAGTTDGTTKGEKAAATAPKPGPEAKPSTENQRSWFGSLYDSAKSYIPSLSRGGSNAETDVFHDAVEHQPSRAQLRREEIAAKQAATDKPNAAIFLDEHGVAHDKTAPAEEKFFDAKEHPSRADERRAEIAAEAERAQPQSKTMYLDKAGTVHDHVDATPSRSWLGSAYETAKSYAPKMVGFRG